ncbi:hypothetical protein IC229_33230 [Spirosoma sp. BT702]|uniref:Uncharacterized protein n=1 Tax=Spirosoma profusum TaxID=2771354 RepID=A0A927AW89_9BACT|nr:hypothetical protein [Spirosoma profusum]MBD2705521.1 hypothetical protein [Spirosoma profusum]
MSDTQNQSLSQSQDNQQQPDLNADILARFEAQDKLIADLQSKLATQPAPVAPVVPAPSKGGVWVNQWRTTEFNGKAVKIDEQRQYYDSDKFDQLNSEVDKKRTGFETLGISYEITEDTRPGAEKTDKKKK